jgi:hypothetical protein
MNKLIPQQITGTLDPISINDPELGDYWRLIQSAEVIGIYNWSTGTWDINFDISYGEGNDFTLIRIHRMYYSDGPNKILVTDFVQDFPPTIQSRAVNFYVIKNKNGKLTVSPYKEVTVPHEIINLMKKVGSFSRFEGARLVIRQPLKQLQEFILKNGQWQPLFLKH